MIDTLSLVQQALQNALFGTVRKDDVYVTGDLSVLPAEAKLPAVGVKDGPASHEELAGGMLRTTFQVQLRIFVEVFRESDAALEVLAIEKAIDEALDENALGSPGIRSAVKVSPTPESLPVTDGQRDMQAKRLAYEYVKETERPSAARGG